MADNSARQSRGLRRAFLDQQLRRRREQYLRTGHPVPRGHEPGDDGAAVAEAPTIAVTVPSSARALVRFRLMALSGDERGEFVELRMGRLRLGRDETCEIRLTDMSVSHFHAVLAVTERGATIDDLGSTNHTYVNDQIVEGPRGLAEGDVIRLGNATLMLQIGH